jgi:ribonucleotide reductase beta subunit family protein with ferritin-like domain
MKENTRSYQEEMFEKISLLFETIGESDADYDLYQKNNDILGVLENLLAYAIYNTNIDLETIKEASEESYVHIKRRALMMCRKAKSKEGEVA